MLKKLLIGIAVAAGLLSSGVSNASPIVWDWSPLTTGATWRGDLQNKTGGQHFGELVSFPTDTYIDGIAIYSEPGGLSRRTISIWEDVSGIPGSLLARDLTVGTTNDYDGATPGLMRKYSDFSGFNMLADINYWIGMAGTDNNEIRLAGMLGTPGGDNTMAKFDGSRGGAFTGFPTGAGDMAFRLYGVRSVPEPTTVALLGLSLVGLVGLGIARKKKLKEIIEEKIKKKPE